MLLVKSQDGHEGVILIVLQPLSPTPPPHPPRSANFFPYFQSRNFASYYSSWATKREKSENDRICSDVIKCKQSNTQFLLLLLSCYSLYFLVSLPLFPLSLFSQDAASCVPCSRVSSAQRVLVLPTLSRVVASRLCNFCKLKATFAHERFHFARPI